MSNKNHQNRGILVACSSSGWVCRSPQTARNMAIPRSDRERHSPAPPATGRSTNQHKFSKCFVHIFAKVEVSVAASAASVAAGNKAPNFSKRYVGVLSPPACSPTTSDISLTPVNTSALETPPAFPNIMSVSNLSPTMSVVDAARPFWSISWRMRRGLGLPTTTGATCSACKRACANVFLLNWHRQSNRMTEGKTFAF